VGGREDEHDASVDDVPELNVPRFEDHLWSPDESNGQGVQSIHSHWRAPVLALQKAKRILPSYGRWVELQPWEQRSHPSHPPHPPIPPARGSEQLCLPRGGWAAVAAGGRAAQRGGAAPAVPGPAPCTRLLSAQSRSRRHSKAPSPRRPLQTRTFRTSPPAPVPHPPLRTRARRRRPIGPVRTGPGLRAAVPAVRRSGWAASVWRGRALRPGDTGSRVTSVTIWFIVQSETTVAASGGITAASAPRDRVGDGTPGSHKAIGGDTWGCMPLPHGWRCCALHTRAITARRAAARQRAGGDAAHCTRALSPHGVLSHGNVRAAMLSTAHARYRRRAGSHPAELGQPRAHRRRPVGPVSAGPGQRAAVPAARRRGGGGCRRPICGSGGGREVGRSAERVCLTAAGARRRGDWQVMPFPCAWNWGQCQGTWSVWRVSTKSLWQELTCVYTYSVAWVQ